MRAQAKLAVLRDVQYALSHLGKAQGRRRMRRARKIGGMLVGLDDKRDDKIVIKHGKTNVSVSIWGVVTGLHVMSNRDMIIDPQRAGYIRLEADPEVAARLTAQAARSWSQKFGENRKK